MKEKKGVEDSTPSNSDFSELKFNPKMLFKYKAAKLKTDSFPRNYESYYALVATLSKEESRKRQDCPIISHISQSLRQQNPWNG